MAETAFKHFVRVSLESTKIAHHFCHNQLTLFHDGRMVQWNHLTRIENLPNSFLQCVIFLGKNKKKLNLISRFRTKCWRIYCSSPLLPRAPSNFYPSLGSTIQMHIFFRKYRRPLASSDACCIQKSVLCALFFFLQNLLCSPLTSITTSRPFSKVHPLFLRFFCIFHIRFDWRNLVIFFSPLCSEPCSSSACKRRFVLTDFARLCSVVVISSLYSPRKRCGRLFGLECIRKQVFVCNFFMH